MQLGGTTKVIVHFTATLNKIMGSELVQVRLILYEVVFNRHCFCDLVVICQSVYVKIATLDGFQSTLFLFTVTLFITRGVLPLPT
jgi:hypothetical protein